MVPFVDLKAQYREIGDEARAAMDGVLERAWYIFGEEGRAFDAEFANWLGAGHALGVNSGTDAIQLALEALGVGPGDDVVTAANTCAPTVCAIAATGARVRLCDIDPATCTMDPAALESALTRATKAVVPVHLYGHPCAMDPILAVAERRGLAVVEDCAQAHGARYRGRMCGTFGHAAAFSFYPSKNLGACGDGGAVVTHDGEVAERVRKLRNYGEEQRYVHTMRGHNSRLDELQAAVLRVKLRRLHAWNAARRERAAWYGALLADAPVAPLAEAPWAESVRHLYVVRSPARDALMAHLKARDVGCLVHYPIPVHLQPGWRDLGYAPGDFPAAEQACDEVLSLPMFPELTRAQCEEVAAAVRAFEG
jgi:dTDP-4-amino-4,6-dideoxygalactose transaminase